MDWTFPTFSKAAWMDTLQPITAQRRCQTQLFVGQLPVKKAAPFSTTSCSQYHRHTPVLRRVWSPTEALESGEDATNGRPAEDVSRSFTG